METNSDTPINSRVTPVRASREDMVKTTKETLRPFRPSLSSAWWIWLLSDVRGDLLLTSLIIIVDIALNKTNPTIQTAVIGFI
mgnify:CR=1 FL=1